MIARPHRFHGFNALRHVYTHGRTVRSPLLAVKFQPNDRRSSYRAAVVVSRKIHKSAVVRNRIRRRIYELIRRSEAQITRPYDIVVTIFSDQVADMAASELETALLEQLTKAGILAQPPQKSHAIVVPKEKQS
jgi:ribonuclease P protein component